MRRLPVTEIDSYVYHERIVAAKGEPRRRRLEAVSATVAGRIAALEDQGPFELPEDDLGHTCGREVCEPCLYDDLRHLWEAPTAPLRQLKAELTQEFDALGLADCPYCGTDPVEGFDHYLPKNAYPEFAVAAVNLFRACDLCNVLKGTARPEGSKRFLHPARDPLDSLVLHCTIDDSREPPRPVFEVDGAAAERAGIGEEVRFHFSELHLGRRFQRAAAPELGAFLLELEYLALPRGIEGALAAESRALSHRATWGPNRWSTVFYFAVADWLMPRAGS